MKRGEIRYNDREFRVETQSEKGTTLVILNSDVARSQSVKMKLEKGGRFSGEVDGKFLEGTICKRGADLWIATPERTIHLRIPQRERKSSASLDRGVHAPMTGKIVQLSIKIGERVKEGERVAILEAMKMEYKLTSPISGLIHKIHVSEGDLVDLGHLIVEIEPSEIKASSKKK